MSRVITLWLLSVFAIPQPCQARVVKRAPDAPLASVELLKVGDTVEIWMMGWEATRVTGVNPVLGEAATAMGPTLTLDDENKGWRRYKAGPTFVNGQDTPIAELHDARTGVLLTDCRGTNCSVRCGAKKPGCYVTEAVCTYPDGKRYLRLPPHHLLGGDVMELNNIRCSAALPASDFVREIDIQDDLAFINRTRREPTTQEKTARAIQKEVDDRDLVACGGEPCRGRVRMLPLGLSREGYDKEVTDAVVRLIREDLRVTDAAARKLVESMRQSGYGLSHFGGPLRDGVSTAVYMTCTDHDKNQACIEWTGRTR